jgi:hypothetical protein
MTPHPVKGCNRPADLYELANAHGLHAGSMDQLTRFAIILQQAALANTGGKEEREEDK